MSTGASAGTEFRLMARRDLPQVLVIEERSFRQPWDKERFVMALERRHGTHCVVLESNGKVIGYFVVELLASGTHLVNLAIHPDHRRAGHASRCLEVIHQLAARAIEIAQARDSALKPTGGEAELSSSSWSAAASALASQEAGPAPPPAPRKESRAAQTGTSEADEDVVVGEVCLEVEESNLPAQLLYRKMGYRATKILRNYYPVFKEDGYRMVRKIRSSSINKASQKQA